MSTAADAWIAALRRSHDDLLAVTDDLTGEQLRGPSGSSEWTIAQVLSHLGSGAEIGLANLEANLAGDEPPPNEANVPIWDRWNAMTPEEQTSSFRSADARLVAAWEAIPDGLRETQQITLPFLPEPISLATAAGFRLSEHAVHAWDVRIGFADDATLRPDDAALLVQRLPQMTGWLGKPGGWTGVVAVTTVDPAGAWTLSVDAESVSLSEGAPADAPARLTLPLEAFVRLIYGRLPAKWTPASVAVDGPVTLDDLRTVFPGF